MSYQHLTGFSVKQQYKNNLSLVVSGAVMWSDKEEFMAHEAIVSTVYNGVELIDIYNQGIFSAEDHWDSDVRKNLVKTVNKAVHFNVSDWPRKLGIDTVPLDCTKRERSIEIYFPTGDNITLNYEAVRAIHPINPDQPIYCNMLISYSIGDSVVTRANAAEFKALFELIDDPHRNDNGSEDSTLYHGKRLRVIEAPYWTTSRMKDQDARVNYEVAQEIILSTNTKP